MKIIGHRGARARAPENTLPGIEMGMACADLVEVDVRLSADGIPVVIHDPTVDRTTDGTGEVNKFTVRDLQALDAGGGETIPTLSQVLEAVSGRSGLVVEIKEPGSEAAVCGMLRSQRPDPLYIVSFHPDSVNKVQELLPGVAAGWIYSRPPPDPVECARGLGATVILPKCGLLTEPLVGKAHRHGLELIPWTLNSVEEWRRARDLGVDGFATDDPCSARAFLDAYRS